MASKRSDAVRRRVISAARVVYEELGWGWREEVYREALAVELRPLCCSLEVAMPVLYKGNPLSHVSVRWDMAVDSCVLVELKAVKSRLPAAAVRQAARYANDFPDYLTLALNFPDRPDAQVEVG